ncbi:MAG: hypothetical protein FRX49_07657 [Trebouxia sp. A1-2]|nr:MAG: hypothetical protein FRX49_07657 [Trebouxia sp. A1-2]
MIMLRQHFEQHLAMTTVAQSHPLPVQKGKDTSGPALPAAASLTHGSMIHQTASWPGFPQLGGQKAGDWLVGEWVERVQPEGLPHPMRMQEMQTPDQVQSNHSTLLAPLQLSIAAVCEGMSQVASLPFQIAKNNNLYAVQAQHLQWLRGYSDHACNKKLAADKRMKQHGRDHLPAAPLTFLVVLEAAAFRMLTTV